jgi:hypothetical protein
MIDDANQLRVTLQQMQRLLWALADLKEQVLSQDPKLCATMAEAPLRLGSPAPGGREFSRSTQACSLVLWRVITSLGTWPGQRPRALGVPWGDGFGRMLRKCCPQPP